ncbi:MAG TPA: type II secretion system protein GspN [Kofleriaceae bacterium]|jgi:type II secretion system protein N|nr:type II secretion system protein GspN [Kofleriaceae bacterium]
MATLFASLGPRARKLLRYVGLVVLAVVSFVLALQATFPYDRVKDRVIQLLSEKGYDAQIGDVERGIMPARVTFKAVSARTRPTKPGDLATTLYLEQLEVDLGLLPLLHGTIAVKIDAKVGQGHLKGSIALSKDATSVHVAGDDLASTNLPVRAALGLPMTGKIRLALDLELPSDRKAGKPNFPKAEGALELACPSGCTIGDGKSKLQLTTNNARQQEFLDQSGGGIDFGRVNVDSLIARAELKNGKLELTRFELKSGDGEAHVAVSVTINQDIMASTVTGCLRFHDSEAFRKREPKTDAALTTTGAPLGPDGLFHIKLDGQIRTMRRIGVVCAGGAGEAPGSPPPRPNLSITPEPAKPAGVGSVGLPAPQVQPAPVAPPPAAPAPPPAAPPAPGGDAAAHVPVEGPPPVVYPSTGSGGVPGAAPMTGSASPPAAPAAPQ